MAVVFGFSFSELVVVVIVALVVIGPKDLPRVLRKAGQWAGKLRRMAAEMRAQSGIDDLLRGEGIADDLREIRKLTRGELDTISRDAAIEPIRFDDAPDAATAPSPYVDHEPEAREYPVEGADSYGAMPDGSRVYDDDLAPSPLARDPLYALGDRDGALPPEGEPGETSTAPAAPPMAEPERDPVRSEADVEPPSRADATGDAATEKSAHE